MLTSLKMCLVSSSSSGAKLTRRSRKFFLLAALTAASSFSLLGRFLRIYSQRKAVSVLLAVNICASDRRTELGVRDAACILQFRF